MDLSSIILSWRCSVTRKAYGLRPRKAISSGDKDLRGYSIVELLSLDISATFRNKIETDSLWNIGNFC